jgi:MFS family permease
MERKRRIWAAIVVAGVAFALYKATLLPGFDFGDTGFLQATVGELDLTPRSGYPLYFAIGNLFVWTTRAEPAHALNLASAVEGAVACGLIVLVAAELSASVLAATGVGLLFAVSYTFWSQAIIAEVYALHMLFVALTLLLLLQWANRPTDGRLVLFFAAYALGFGNHLSMILLLPGYALFLALAAPQGWRSMLRPRIVALALAIAVAGSLQYLWNLRGLWLWPNAPPRLAEALLTFWFDVTKTDWRETMVLHVPESMVRERLAMYWFEVFQQFGWAVLLAPLGLIRLLGTNWRHGVLMLALFAANVAFAFSYNVGDTHVFYLPSHLMLALLAAPGIAAVGRLAAAPLPARARAGAISTVCAVLIADAAVRAHRDFPALDRSGDHRPTEVMSHMTAGLDDQHAILLADLNWQLVNGLAYFAKVLRPDIAYAWMSEVLLYAPALVNDNLTTGRDVALTERARDTLTRAYGPLLPTVVDQRVRVVPVSEIVGGLPPGTRYVLCVIKPTREFAIDARDLEHAALELTGGQASMPVGDYAALAGLVGRPPALAMASPRPFHQRVQLDGVDVDVRMESWIAFDTIRRMGFGQVIAARRHTLIVERGISFAAFDAAGRDLRTGYLANVFAPQPRYLAR